MGKREPASEQEPGIELCNNEPPLAASTPIGNPRGTRDRL